MSLCFQPEDDEKLARGWPNVIVPVDAHPHDKRAQQSAEKAWRVSDPIYFVEWPRETLHRYVRAAAASLFINHENVELIAKAHATSGAPSASELLDAIKRMFETGYDTYYFNERNFVYGVEVIAGTDATLDAIVGAIETANWPKPETLNYVCRAAMLETTAFLMLRASPKIVKDARARLEKLSIAPRDGGKAASDYDYFFQTFDYVLHGAAGVKRAMSQIALAVDPLYIGATLDYAGDDPDFVRAKCAEAKKTAPMSVRVAYLGGPTVLEGLGARKWRAAELPSVLRDFGMIRDPAIAAFMLSLVGKSSVKDAPLEWFRAHAAFAKPILAKSNAAMAKTVLKQL